MHAMRWSSVHKTNAFNLRTYLFRSPWIAFYFSWRSQVSDVTDFSLFSFSAKNALELSQFLSLSPFLPRLRNWKREGSCFSPAQFGLFLSLSLSINPPLSLSVDRYPIQRRFQWGKGLLFISIPYAADRSKPLFYPKTHKNTEKTEEERESLFFLFNKRLMHTFIHTHKWLACKNDDEFSAKQALLSTLKSRFKAPVY